MMIVTGATGRTGSEVVRLLSARGIRVRALVRDAVKARSMGLTGPGIEIVTADLAKPITLDPAFRGGDKLFLVSSPDPDVATLHGNAIEAAKRAGVRQIVRLSVYGSNPASTALLLRTHGEVDERLSRSGISYTILRPSSFYQSTFVYADSIAAMGVIHAVTRDGAVAMIDLRDVAIVATAVLAGDSHSGRVYDLTGPEALTQAQVAAKLAAALERPIEAVDVTVEEARASLLTKMPAWLVDALLELAVLQSGGKMADLSDAFERIVGKKPRSYDQFLKDFAPVFGRAEKVVAG